MDGINLHLNKLLIFCVIFLEYKKKRKKKFKLKIRRKFNERKEGKSENCLHGLTQFVFSTKRNILMSKTTHKGYGFLFVIGIQFGDKKFSFLIMRFEL